LTLASQVVIAFLLYLGFWGWLGYRRGAMREFWLLVISVGAWVLLQERGTILVRLANFAGKFVALVSAGGLGEDSADALQALADAPNVVTAENEPGFLFLGWVLIVMFTYIVLSDGRWNSRSRKGALGGVLGALNGLVFAAILLPILANLVELSDGTFADAPLQNVIDLTLAVFTRILDFLRGFWELITPVSGQAWFALIFLILIVAAFTLRSKGKPSEKPKS
jgi:hypothetical protein